MFWMPFWFNLLEKAVLEWYLKFYSLAIILSRIVQKDGTDFVQCERNDLYHGVAEGCNVNLDLEKSWKAH